MSILPGDEFPEAIKRQIDASNAVIVIWTSTSVNSKWVRAEAARADEQNKLITVYAPGLDLRQIPLPFNNRHLEPLANRDKIYLALSAIIGKVKTPPNPPAEDADSLFQKGKNYYFGEYGYPKDRGFARDYFKRAADLGHAEAALEYGCGSDGELRLYYLNKSAELGNTKAIRHLGYAFESGSGVRKDEAAAHGWYLRGARLGGSDCMYDVANMYRDGKGTQQDQVQARYWYLKGTHEGHQGCHRMLESHTSRYPTIKVSLEETAAPKAEKKRWFW